MLLSSSSTTESIHQFVVTDIEGNKFDFSTLKGKKIMVVNTASRCGLTPQYEKLEELYTKYKSKNFVIVGFPANDFLMQEPGSNEDIAKFCKKNYGVSFPMMSKISVNGKKIHPVYKFLTKKSLNGLKDNKVEWNFQKYLLINFSILTKNSAPIPIRYLLKRNFVRINTWFHNKFFRKDLGEWESFRENHSTHMVLPFLRTMGISRDRVGVGRGGVGALC
jgi:glutathione peroxidase